MTSLLVTADVGTGKEQTEKKEGTTSVGWTENFKFPEGKTEKDGSNDRTLE